MNQLITVLFVLGLSAGAHADSFHRCYASMKYEVGLFSPLAWQVIGEHNAKKPTEQYAIHSFSYINKIPAELLLPGGQLEILLNSKMIAVARLLPIEGGVEAIILDKKDFGFLRENTDLSQFALIYDYMGGNWVGTLELMKHPFIVDVLIGDLFAQQGELHCSYDPQR